MLSDHPPSNTTPSDTSPIEAADTKCTASPNTSREQESSPEPASPPPGTEPTEVLICRDSPPLASEEERKAAVEWVHQKIYGRDNRSEVLHDDGQDGKKRESLHQDKKPS